MTSLAICDNAITVSKGLFIDHYDNLNHIIIDIPTKLEENDAVSDIVVSENCKHLALITSASKQLMVYQLPLAEKYKSFVLPRSASKIRFSADNDHILVADKSGDVLIYNIQDADTGTKLLGHLSLLLDVLQTNNRKYIITSDRDEKIRVSCYPNTYNIQTYCLGHKEFVNHVEMLPHNDSILTSTSGDGHVRCWDYVKGTLCYSIDTYLDVDDSQLRESFIKAMDSEGVEVSALPIVHYTVAKLDETSSILALVVHTFNQLLVYRLQSAKNEFSHKLIEKLSMDRSPTAIKLHKSSLYVYDDVDCNVSVFNIVTENYNISITFREKLSMFKNKIFDSKNKEEIDPIRVLYKRKFDNVQEYQERKRQRLEKTVQ